MEDSGKYRKLKYDAMSFNKDSREFVSQLTDDLSHSYKEKEKQLERFVLTIQTDRLNILKLSLKDHLKKLYRECWDRLNPAERQLGLDIIAHREKLFANWGAQKPPQLVLDLGLKGTANANNNEMQARGQSGHFVSGNPNDEISYHGPRSPQEAFYGSRAVYGQNFAPGIFGKPIP